MQEKQDKTKEQIIVDYIKNNLHVSKDIIMEKFNTSKDYSIMIIRKTKNKLIDWIEK